MFKASKGTIKLSFLHLVSCLSFLLWSYLKGDSRLGLRKAAGREGKLLLLTLDPKGVSCTRSREVGGTGRTTKRKRCSAAVPSKSSFFGVQVCHRGMTSDNDKE